MSEEKELSELEDLQLQLAWIGYISLGLKHLDPLKTEVDRQIKLLKDRISAKKESR